MLLSLLACGAWQGLVWTPARRAYVSWLPWSASLASAVTVLTSLGSWENLMN